MAFSTVKRWFPRVHLEKMRGNPEQNLEYCSKEDLNPFTCGDIPKPGKRTDLHDVAEMIKDGCTMMELADIHPTSIIKYHRGITVLRSIRAGKRDPNNPPSVFWFMLLSGLEGPHNVTGGGDKYNFGIPVKVGSFTWDITGISVKDSEQKRECCSFCSEVIKYDTLLSVIAIKPFDSLIRQDKSLFRTIGGTSPIPCISSFACPS